MDGRKRNALRDERNKVKSFAKMHALEGMEFYYNQAMNEHNDPKFRKLCWDAILERGEGKSAAQAPLKAQKPKRMMIMGPITKDSINASKKIPDREFDLEREESFEGDDQADMG